MLRPRRADDLIWFFGTLSPNSLLRLSNRALARFDLSG
jgi:hypothetical protein